MKKLNDAVDRFAFSHPNFGVPNLMRYIVAGNVIVFLLLRLTNYALFPFLGFNWGEVLHLQLWRLVSFIFVPDTFDPFSLILSLYFTYFIGNLLEREWGTPKFNLYYLSGVVLTILTGIISYYAFGSSASTIYSTYYIGMSMFLAFALLFPNTQVLLMFIFPIKVKWLGIVYGIILLVNCIQGGIATWIVVIFSLLNFLVFFLRSKGKMHLWGRSSGSRNFIRRCGRQGRRKGLRGTNARSAAERSWTETIWNSVSAPSVTATTNIVSIICLRTSM